MKLLLYHLPHFCCHPCDDIILILIFSDELLSCCWEKAHIPRHLNQEARGCGHLVLWLDCDREGENICFEGNFFYGIDLIYGLEICLPLILSILT